MSEAQVEHESKKVRLATNSLALTSISELYGIGSTRITARWFLSS